MSATLLDVFEGSNGSADAIVLPASSPHSNTTFSYSHLRDAVAHFQAQLASLNLEPTTVVSSSLVNGIEFTVSFLAVGGHRLVSAPLNPAYGHQEVLFYLQDTRSALLLVPAGALKASPPPPTVTAAREAKVPLAEAVYDSKSGFVQLVLEGSNEPAGKGQSRRPQAEDVALVLHTSGTTGRPKAVPLSHRNLVTTMGNIVDTYKLTSADRTYLVMPLFHVHGLLCGLLATLLSGGAAVIPPKFSATAFWPELSKGGCTWYTAVPTIHQMLLSSAPPSDLPSLRFIRSCSSSLSPTTFAALEKAYGAPVLEAYAMTEAAHQMTSNPLPPAARKAGSVGLGQGVEVRILDQQGKTVPQGSEGEVCVRGRNVTRGYLNNDKANAESFVRDPQENDGFFRTGDQGKLDKDGYLQLTGRIKELINRSGEKISPLEVDAALLSVEGVGEAVAFAMPDEMYGEKVGAVVVPKKGAKELSQKEIQASLQGKISKFKIPERIWVADSIPKT